jgi:lysophospholipase L1-like esterase
VLWLGDSHSAADFLPNAVRTALADRFGSGGPGFVHAGIKGYRHSHVRIDLSGRWRTEPVLPSASSSQGDGVFGLGGLRARGEPPQCRVVIELAKGVLRGRALWQVMYRLPGGARVRARFGNTKPFLLQTLGARASVQRLERETASAEPLKLEVIAGGPELFGVVIEDTMPGLVIDTLGINGARLSTALAWQEGAWIEQVAARKPELVVFAYGTNEAFEKREPQRYREHFSELLGRVQRARPNVSCLILGPPDLGDVPRAAPRIAPIEAVARDAARALGCGFFSLRAAMGGEGSFSRWANANPALARTDRVHLTPRGYAELGNRLAERLLQAYTRR